MSTTSGEAVFRALELGDPDWLNVRWDWPICPLDREGDDA